VPPGETQKWLDGDPYSGAEGWVEYLGGDRVAVEVGSRRYEASIRPRMSKIWERHRSDRRRRILYGRGSFDNKGCVASALLAMINSGNTDADPALSPDERIIVFTSKRPHTLSQKLMPFFGGRVPA